MEDLLTKIKTNDITEVKNWLLAKPDNYKFLNFYRLVEAVDDSKMFCTILDICGEAICEYYRKHDTSIILHLMREGKNLNIIEAILKLDKDCINRVDESGMTPLMYCVLTNCDISFIKYLLKNNADVNIGNICGETPLHCAHNVEVVKLLIKYDANINCCDEGGSTPLMTAIKYKRDEKIILEFLKNNADVEVRNCHGQTCLHLALYYRYGIDIINQIRGKIHNCNVEDSEGLTPLCYALNDRNTRILQSSYQKHYIYTLINKGFVINAKVLMHAVKYCQDFDLIIGLTRYVDVRCYDNDGNCVLHHANDAKLIKMLVRQGASINHENNVGQTPLIYSIIHRKSIKIIESLLFWGSDMKKLDFFLNVSGLDNLIISDAVYDLLVLYGMSVDLKSNFIQSFLSHQLNLIANPKPIRPNIGLLRHIFLSNKSINVSEKQISEGEVSKLISKFKIELNKMKEIDLVKNMSYRDFCLKQYRSRRIIDENFLRDNREKIENLFPMFFNEVIIKIKIHLKINRLKGLCRSVIYVTLAKRIERKNVFCKDDDSSCDYVALDCDSMCILGSYMSERDIKCLLAAAVS